MNFLCENVDHHRQVMEILKAKNNVGQSYTPKQDRKTLLVMKDIHFSVDIEDIAADIEEQTGLKPTLKRMETVKSKEGGYTLNCVVATIEEEKAKELTKVRHVANCLIRWDKLLKSAVTQCHRCQLFEHLAKNRYACVT